MKKLIALLLAVMMAVSMFAACGNSEPEETQAPEVQNTESGETTPVSESQEEADPLTGWIMEDTSISGTVRFWVPFKGTQGMDAMIADFNQTYPNITVELNTYNNNADGNLSVNTAIMAEEVDVLASFGLANTYTRWESGLYQDLTDLVTEENIDLVANWGTDAYTYDGSVYTFPCGGLSYYIAINMDAWEAAGLGELPTEWTWEEYLAACEAMTVKNEDGTVAVYGGADMHSIEQFTYTRAQVVGQDAFYNEDGTSAFDSDVMVGALARECKAELEDEIWFPKSVYRGDNLQSQQTFLVDQVINSSVTNNMVRYMSDVENYGVDFKVGFAPYPVEEAGQTNYMSGVMPFSHAGIAEGCQDFDAAWAFLKWYSTYGVKYLAAAGHQSNWLGTESGSALALLFGSEEEAAKYVDVDSFKAVVGVASNPSYHEENLTAYSDCATILKEYAMYALNGTMTAEEAMAEAAKLANEKIEAAK